MQRNERTHIKVKFVIVLMLPVHYKVTEKPDQISLFWLNLFFQQ